jgi:hypothetical protein
MLLIAQTIGAASANANNRNGLGRNRSDCSEAAQPMRGRGRQRLPLSQLVQNLTLTGGSIEGSSACLQICVGIACEFLLLGAKRKTAKGRPSAPVREATSRRIIAGSSAVAVLLRY